MHQALRFDPTTVEALTREDFLEQARTAKHAPKGTRRGLSLTIRGLRKSFGDNAVLRGIDLHIPAGQFVAIVGQSGCGKSTLLRLIAGLETGYLGRITLDGAPIVAPGLDRGIVFQDHRLLPWMTLEKNVELALRMRA